MNIRRLSTLSLIILLAIPIGVYGHCAGKHTDNHPHCSSGGENPSVVYEAELQGAFVFGSLPVTLEGQDERLINDDPVTISSPATNGAALTTWNDVFDVCGLFGEVTEFTAAGGKKGWRIARPGGVYVQFPIRPLASTIGDLDVTLQLIGDCSYSSSGTEDCDPFPPVPGDENDGISEIPLTHFQIHAREEKGQPHKIEGCHSKSGDLGVDSILVITAIEP